MGKLQVPKGFDLASWADAHKIKWVYEESREAEKDPEVRERSEWYVEIRGKRGMIYVGGLEEVVVYTAGRGMKSELLALGGRLHQGGDSECALLVPVAALLRVCDVVQAPKRRPGRAGGVPEAKRAVGRAKIAASRANKKNPLTPPGETDTV